MKYLSIIFITLAFACFSCNEKEDVYPDCVSSAIKELKKDPCNQASVTKFSLQDKIVYVYGVDCCCDMMATVIDENCDEVCYLGGIAGLDECFGEKFSEKATKLEVVWEKK